MFVCVCVNCFLLFYMRSSSMYHKFTILSGLLGIWKKRRILQFLHMLSTYRNHTHFINNSGWTGALEVDKERLRKTVSECSGGRKGSKKHLKSLSNGLLFSQSFRAHPKIKMMPSFTQLHVSSNCISSMEHKRRYFEKCFMQWDIFFSNSECQW